MAETTTRKKFTFSKKTRSNMENVNKIMVELAEKAIAKSTVDFGVINNGGFRTREMQSELYKAGKSQLDGFYGISTHQIGNALDFVPYINKKYTWADEKAFKAVHTAVIEAWSEMNVKGVQLIWGGSWKNFYDPYHYHIRAKLN